MKKKKDDNYDTIMAFIDFLVQLIADEIIKRLESNNIAESSKQQPDKESGRLRTVKQFASTTPIFTESSLRWQMFNSATNGMDEYNVIVRLGKRVFIDVVNFEQWLASQKNR